MELVVYCRGPVAAVLLCFVVRECVLDRRQLKERLAPFDDVDVAAAALLLRSWEELGGSGSEKPFMPPSGRRCWCATGLVKAAARAWRHTVNCASGKPVVFCRLPCPQQLGVAGSVVAALLTAACYDLVWRWAVSGRRTTFWRVIVSGRRGVEGRASKLGMLRLRPSCWLVGVEGEGPNLQAG